MAQAKRRVLKQINITKGNDFSDRITVKTKWRSYTAVKTPVRSRKKCTEGAGDPIRKPYRQALKKDRRFSKKIAMPLWEDKKI